MACLEFKDPKSNVRRPLIHTLLSSRGHKSIRIPFLEEGVRIYYNVHSKQRPNMQYGRVLKLGGTFFALVSLNQLRKVVHWSFVL